MINDTYSLKSKSFFIIYTGKHAISYSGHRAANQYNEHFTDRRASEALAYGGSIGLKNEYNIEFSLQGCQADPNQLKLAEVGWSFP